MTYFEFPFLTVPLEQKWFLLHNKILCKRQLAGEGGVRSGWKQTAGGAQAPLLPRLPFSERQGASSPIAHKGLAIRLSFTSLLWGEQAARDASLGH